MAKDRLKTAAIIGVAPLLAALGYTCWTFYSRSEQAREVERQTEAKKAEEAKKFLSTYGGDEVRITVFYASPQAVPRGGTVSICYGVLNATKLYTEPPLPNIYPALSHCVQTTLSKTTTYRLVAEDKNSKQATEEITVAVK